MTVFSEHERMILKIVGRRKMTVQEISEEFYNSRNLPLEGRNYVAQVIRRIARKCELMKSTWTLEGKGSGRHGRTVWRSKRSGTKTDNH